MDIPTITEAFFACVLLWLLPRGYSAIWAAIRAVST